MQSSTSTLSWLAPEDAAGVVSNEAPGDAESAPFLARVLNEVCFGKEETFPLAETLARYFSPDYRQRVDGQLLSRAEFEAHIRHLRQRLTGGRIEMIECLRVGTHIADRHRIHATKRGGAEMQVEVFLFGELAADGRLFRVDEVTRLIAGVAADADMGRAL